jgi:hypothetical protein
VRWCFYRNTHRRPDGDTGSTGCKPYDRTTDIHTNSADGYAYEYPDIDSVSCPANGYAYEYLDIDSFSYPPNGYAYKYLDFQPYSYFHPHCYGYYDANFHI